MSVDTHTDKKEMNTVLVNAEREDTVVFSVRLRCGCMKARDENLARGERELMVDAGAHPQSLHSTFFFFQISRVLAAFRRSCSSVLPLYSPLFFPSLSPHLLTILIFCHDNGSCITTITFSFFFFTCGSQNLCVCFFFSPLAFAFSCCTTPLGYICVGDTARPTTAKKEEKDRCACVCVCISVQH